MFFGAKTKKKKKKKLVQNFFWARPGTKKFFFGVQILRLRSEAYVAPTGPKSIYPNSTHPKPSKNKRNASKALSFGQMETEIVEA